MPIDRHGAKPVKGLPGIHVVTNDDPRGLDRYLVRIVVRDPKTGKKVDRKGVVEGTLEDAIALRDRLRKREIREVPTRERFRDFGARWASEHLPTVEPSTKARYIVCLAHLNRGFGDHFVDAIEVKDLRSWLRSQEGEFSASTINGWLTVMRLVLDEAVGAGMLKVNPARKTKALATAATTGRRAVALSPGQFRSFLAALEAERESGGICEDSAAMIAVLAWTGARMGELRALKWEDWVDGELHVRRAVWRNRVKTTKNKDPRSVHVVEPLAEALSRQRRRLVQAQHPGLESGLMFPCSLQAARCGASRRKSDELFWFRSASFLSDPLRRVCHKAGVPEMSPHALRRTWEKMMRKADVDGMVRRSIAGWRTETAQTIYTDVDVEDRAAAGNAMLRLVGPASDRARDKAVGDDADSAVGPDGGTRGSKSGPRSPK